MDVSSMGNMNPFTVKMSGMGSRPDPGRMSDEVNANKDGGLDPSEFQVLVGTGHCIIERDCLL